MRTSGLGWLAALLLTLAVQEVHAFSVSTAITTPCHEPITMEVLRKVRATQPAAGPLVSTGRDDRALIGDLPFKVDEDMRDLGAVTLLIGVRDNDLKGRDPNELDSVALVHGDPTSQREHCLRSPTDDEPEGTQNALLACRAFIREQFLDALEGLDGAGRPTLDARMELGVALSLRGKLSVPLPRFYVRIGQAMHALQDSFTHNYRPGERTRVSTTLNYVDVVDLHYLMSRDGPQHSMELDKCDATDALRARNRQLAVEASTELLEAALVGGTHAQKVGALELVLDRYLTYEPGCTEANGWCHAPEAEIQAAKGCGCGATGWTGLLGLSLLLLVVARRTKRVAGALLVLALAVPISARAQEPDPSAKPPEEVGAVVPITPAEVKAVEKEEEHQRSRFALSAAAAGSLYNTAIAGVIGARVRLSDNWQLGLDAELNGWYGIHSRQMRTGATNVYLSLIVRYPLKYEQINLRSNLQLGIAVQMFDLVGVPAGSVGVYGGFNPLGIEIKLTNHLYLVFYPLGFALPVTQLKGAPFAFAQFRTTLGLEVSF